MIHKAEAGMNSHGDIGTFCEMLGNLVKRIFRVIYSIGLLIGLFAPAKGKFHGLAGFMNEWYSGFSVLIIMGLSLLAAYYLKR
ncbi:hypothetical protein I5677_08860 [Mobilitalea sibirica]|uniref:Uncharacterized protein n=1 Tax=Mobilitalea sibirica TaxID=1462919 RepID=A0A8J7HDN8_9FIRM|nr:hypothetical protein [Mobilitalea sibirica]MBH1940999.1 hypothetical protein [Mobilitalea sibirica]